MSSSLHSLHSLHPEIGVPQPLLFERLEDSDLPATGTPAANRAAIEASISREIGALLATRIDPSVDAIDPRDRTVLEYGLPDISALAARSTREQDRIARMIERAIMAFEPRLAHPQVTIIPELMERDKLTVVVAGMVRVGLVAEAFAFAMEVGEAGGVSGG